MRLMKMANRIPLGRTLSLVALLFIAGAVQDNVRADEPGSPAAQSLELPAPSAEVYLKVAAELEANLKEHILEKFFPATLDEKNGGFIENFSVIGNHSSERLKHRLSKPTHLDQRRSGPTLSRWDRSLPLHDPSRRGLPGSENVG